MATTYSNAPYATFEGARFLSLSGICFLCVCVCDKRADPDSHKVCTLKVLFHA